MSRGWMEWAPYVPVAERRRQAEKLTAKLRKQGKTLAPVIIVGRAIASTFWGKAWCGNLEAYRDYESRLPRGRSYVRNGAVIDLQIAPGEVRALVNGSELYRTSVTIRPLAHRPGGGSAPTAPAASTAWWSCCRGGFRRRSWSGSAGKTPASSRVPPRSASTVAARIMP